MFHLYFGAFDILLYLGGIYFAMVLADAICEERPKAKTLVQTYTPTSNQLSASAQSPINIPHSKKVEERQPVRVSH